MVAAVRISSPNQQSRWGVLARDYLLRRVIGCIVRPFCSHTSQCWMTQMPHRVKWELSRSYHLWRWWDHSKESWAFRSSAARPKCLIQSRLSSTSDCGMCCRKWMFSDGWLTCQLTCVTANSNGKCVTTSFDFDWCHTLKEWNIGVMNVWCKCQLIICARWDCDLFDTGGQLTCMHACISLKHVRHVCTNHKHSAWVNSSRERVNGPKLPNQLWRNRRHAQFDVEQMHDEGHVKMHVSHVVSLRSCNTNWRASDIVDVHMLNAWVTHAKLRTQMHFCLVDWHPMVSWIVSFVCPTKSVCCNHIFVSFSLSGCLIFWQGSWEVRQAFHKGQMFACGSFEG